MNEDSFLSQNLSFDSNNDLSDTLNISQVQIQKEVKAVSFFKIHLLNPIFKEWRFIAIRRRKMQEMEIKFIRWQIDQIQRIYFIKWTNTLDFREKLHNLGAQLLISKHFFLWINFIRSQYLDKDHYRKVILARRRIYNQNYFKKWRHAILLKRKYNFYSKNEEKFLCLKIIQAFHVYIKKKRKFENAMQYLQQIRTRAILIQWYKNWKYARMTRYIHRNYNFLIQQASFNHWYLSMKIKVKLRRKFRYIYNIHKQQMLQKAFDLWYYKFFRLNDINDKFDKLLKITQNRTLSIFFHNICSAFNYKMYLLQTEEKLLFKLETLKLKHFLSFWAIRTFKIHRFNKAIYNTILSLNRHRLNFAFQKWKSKYTIINHYQNMINKVRSSYKAITTRRFLLQWYSEYRYLINNKKSYNKAILFRSICLKLKAFRTFQSNVKYSKMRKDQKNKVNFLIEIIYFYKWKRRYLKYRRRFILISAVLKNWAATVQKKMFDRWISYIHMKHQKANEYLKAQLVFNQCNIAFVIDSFVAGCPKNQEIQKQIDDDLPNSILPNFDNINDKACDGLASTQLSEPKIPSFMKKQSSPKRDFDSHLHEIELQFKELVRKCEKEGASADDRAQMLFLIQEMNRIRSQFTVS